MFKEFAQFGQMLNQARQLTGKLGEIQQQLADMRIPGRSRDGRVLVELTGRGQLVRCEIAPELLRPEAAAAIEQGLIEATQAAQELVREAALAAMGDAAGGVDLSRLTGGLPGFGAG